MYDPHDDPVRVIERAAGERTMLTEYFELRCKSAYAHKFTYQQFPQYFVWHRKEKKWTPGQQGEAIGRLYSCDPGVGEKYYLRLLLTRVRGVTSFNNLKGGLPTFKAACMARGFLEDDSEWVQCIEECLIWKTGGQLRALFALILIMNHPNNPENLWDRFKENLCDDHHHRLVCDNLNPNATEAQARMTSDCIFWMRFCGHLGTVLGIFPICQFGKLIGKHTWVID